MPAKKPPAKPATKPPKVISPAPDAAHKAPTTHKPKEKVPHAEKPRTNSPHQDDAAPLAHVPSPSHSSMIAPSTPPEHAAAPAARPDADAVTIVSMSAAAPGAHSADADKKAQEPLNDAPDSHPVMDSDIQDLSSSGISLVQTDPDDNDYMEQDSLLAGPRNVQPYIVKRGEQYMSKEQSEHFRQILSTWKRDLMEEVDRTVTHMKDEAANFPDPNDRATQEEEFSLELRTRDRERKLIRKIEEAIKRIEDGSYGYCLETGEEIGIKRLEARPVATLSIEAQERRERRERQYGDRDDRYR